MASAYGVPPVVALPCGLRPSGSTPSASAPGVPPVTAPAPVAYAPVAAPCGVPPVVAQWLPPCEVHPVAVPARWQYSPRSFRPVRRSLSGLRPCGSTLTWLPPSLPLHENNGLRIAAFAPYESIISIKACFSSLFKQPWHRTVG